MSFILDALKKSEAERQQQAGAEFSNVPSRSGEPQSLKWLWILAFLLLVNFAFLAVILLRPDDSADVPAPVETVPIEQTSIAKPSFEDKVAAAKLSRPARVDPAPEDSAAQSQPTTPPPAAAPVTRGYVPTIDEARLDGTLQVAELHLDIHVYSEDPAERFVFINMTKHREQSRLDEGPVVEEITPDGVILEHQGTTFLLPRE